MRVRKGKRESTAPTCQCTISPSSSRYRKSALNLNVLKRLALSPRFGARAEFHGFQNSLKQSKVLVKELGPCP